ncbi:MAG: AmmeMemoRadiSam system protein A [Firmicutes bacterium]|nr:AmmeMemoRadiSam system protein A [Bacillota bacterium]
MKQSIYKNCLIAILILALFADVFASTSFLNKLEKQKDKKLTHQILKLAKMSLKTYFDTGEILPVPQGLRGILKMPSGVFVTIVKNEKVRGCMGTLYPSQEDLAHEIVRSTILAATQDKRVPPLKKSELNKVKFIVSVPGNLRKVYSVSQLDPAKYGLMIKKGEKSALLLPGEARTAIWQMQECKRKAGIPRNEKVEMYIFRTVTFGPEEE